MLSPPPPAAEADSEAMAGRVDAVGVGCRPTLRGVVVRGQRFGRGGSGVFDSDVRLEELLSPRPKLACLCQSRGNCSHSNRAVAENGSNGSRMLKVSCMIPKSEHC